MATGKGGSDPTFWGKAAAPTPPPPRVPGPRPTSAGFDPIHLLGQGIHAVLHGTAAPDTQAQAAFKQAHPLNAGTFFTPATLGLDQLIHAPQLLKSAHQTAVKIAHPSAQNPPSLSQNVQGLLGGAFGLPRMGANYEGPVHPRMIPRVPKGETTAATGGDLGRQVREGLRGANTARTAQDKLYSAERGTRAAAASQAMTELGGQAGYHAALGKLKGELPKLQFNGMENFDQAGLDSLFNHVQNHPTLRPFEKIRTQAALLKVLNGSVPTKSELDLMGHVFGREVSGRLAASVPTWAKAKNLGLELLNVPRSVMSSFDLSAPFRQGLVAGAGHPKIFFSNFAPMVKAFGSEKVYQGIVDGIATRPTFPTMQKAGLALTDLESMTGREEQFVSNLAEKIPAVGRVIRGSGRAYTGFLTKTRADVFDSLLKSAQEQGLNIGDEQVVKSIAKYVNSATGRGDLGALKGHAVTLNTLFFSPRLLASRVNFLNPVYYAKLDPFARQQALRSMRNLVGTVTLVLSLAKAGGAQVNLDPRNADFGKMRFGNTRIDILGGFQQPIRLMAQLFSGKVISSTTGKTLTLGPQGPGKLSRWDIAQRFVESKLGPVPSFVKDAGKGVDSVGQPLQWDKFTMRNPVVQRMLPLLSQDVYQLDQQKGLLPALGGAVVGSLGVGLQTYGSKPPKASPGGSSSFYSTGGSSGSSFYGSGGGSSSSFWGK